MEGPYPLLMPPELLAAESSRRAEPNEAPDSVENGGQDRPTAVRMTDDRETDDRGTDPGQDISPESVALVMYFALHGGC